MERDEVQQMIREAIKELRTELEAYSDASVSSLEQDLTAIIEDKADGSDTNHRLNHLENSISDLENQ